MKPEETPWMIAILIPWALAPGEVEKVLGPSVCLRESRHDLAIVPAESLLSRQGELTIWVDHYRTPWQDSSGEDTGPESPLYSQSAADHHLLAEPWSLKRAVEHHRGCKQPTATADDHREYVVLRVPLQAGGHALSVYEAILDLARDFLLKTPGSCFFNPRAEILCSLHELEHIRQACHAAALPPVELLVHPRIFELEEDWALADSVGMAQLNLADQEVAFNESTLGVDEALDFVINLARHLITHRPEIKSGDTTSGPQGTIWEALRLGQAALAPHRKVIRWLPENRQGMPAGFDVP